jgi:sec-independent protein translocase protein TatA
MGINLSEGLLITAIVTFFFGGKKIPELGKTLGQSMKSFKEGMKGDTAEATQEKKPVETKPS